MRLFLLALATALSACSSSPDMSAVPKEFRAVCGHAGSHVEVEQVPVTVKHSDCDLTGVQVTYRDYGGAYVPNVGEVGVSTGLLISVNPRSGDVTITAPKGPPGNA